MHILKMMEVRTQNSSSTLPFLLKFDSSFQQHHFVTKYQVQWVGIVCHTQKGDLLTLHLSIHLHDLIKCTWSVYETISQLQRGIPRTFKKSQFLCSLGVCTHKSSSHLWIQITRILLSILLRKIHMHSMYELKRFFLSHSTLKEYGLLVILSSRQNS